MQPCFFAQETSIYDILGTSHNYFLYTIAIICILGLLFTIRQLNSFKQSCKTVSGPPHYKINC